jgi:transposase
MNHLGIDVHKDESHVAVLDDDGEVDRKFASRTRISTRSPRSMLAHKQRSKPPATTTRSTILSMYVDVVVADPQQIKAIGVAEVKNDRLDAKLL